MSKRVIGLDCETVDNLLKTAGYSWKYGQGKVLCTALYYEAEDALEVIAGLHNTNCPFSEEKRQAENAKIVELLQNPDVCLVGANLQYDIGWILYEYGMTTYDVKCSLVDVLQAEHILDEWQMHSLESLSWRYLKYGKTKDRIEEWVHTNVTTKGDFRKHLEKAPYDLLEEYVKGDAKNPVKIWRKQLTLLKEQDLCERAKLEFDCILPSLEMTRTGIPIDIEQKKKNLEFLDWAIKKLHEDFMKQYNLPSFRITASRDIAHFLDIRNIPYNYAVTLVGYNGKRFMNGEETDKAYAKAKQIVSSFRLKKGKPVAHVPKEMVERTEELLKEEGFMFNSSPNVDKKYFESKRNIYPEVALIADWKLAVGIKSKILGDNYDRYITTNFKDEYCVKPQFKITDTISFRYSSNMPNCIAGNMRVLTSKGWEKIKNLKVGDTIYNGNGDLTHVKNIWNKGKQNCLLTVSDNGYKIITTPEHKVWTGFEEKEIGNCEQIGIIQRRTDNKNVQVYAYKGTDCGCFSDKSEYNNRSVEEKVKCTGVQGFEDTTQNQNSSGLCESKGRFSVCERICLPRKTLFQRFMFKIQSFFEQRKKLSKTILDRRTEKRAAQLTSSSSKISAERSIRKTLQNLQGRLYRFGWLCFCLYRSHRRGNKQSKTTQESICRSFRAGCTPVAFDYGCTSYRHKPLEQQLGQLGTVYKTSTQKVTQYFTRAQEVYDIEVASEDHSFICEGFRVFNCQQVPSKNGLELKDGDKKIEVSFAQLTRALFTRSKGCVFGKIDYGQIEYRLICNIACGESGKEVRKQYAENPHLDFHQYVVDLTGLSRKYAKNMSFGVSFGMGLPSMAENFGWSMEKAEEIAEAYHSKMPFVTPTLELVGDIAKEKGYIKTAYGSHARLPYYVEDGKKIPDKKKSYTMLNRYTQGSGAECLKKAIVQAYKEGIWKTLKVANTIHDELSFPYLEPTEEKMLAFYRMAEIMRNSMPNLRVPLEAEIELGDNWANTEVIPKWLELRDNNDAKWVKASSELKEAVNICEKLLKEGRVVA